MGRAIDDCDIVPAGDYPSLLTDGARHQAMATLKSRDMLERARRVIAMRSAELRGAVHDLVEQLEAAMRAGDAEAMREATHEIRGMAGTVNLSATGAIANGLYRYLEAVAERGAAPDPSIVRLHIDAVNRSARTVDDAAQHGDAVVEELAALVEYKLAEIKSSATP